jgi:hypothetical protein
MPGKRTGTDLAWKKQRKGIRMEVQHFSDYGDAIKAALEWLSRRGVTKLEEAFEARMGGFGMRTSDGRSGYRIEFDRTSGAHINVWDRKTKGAHFTFPGNENAVRTKWRQLFWWDPNLKKRSTGDFKI